MNILSPQFPRRRAAASPPSRPARARSAFSLVEVLLAIFILGIGMIMVASVFPVGANWTRQTTEESVGQIIAQDALAVIQSHYGVSGDLHRYLAPDYPNLNLILTTPNPANPVPPPFGKDIPNAYLLQALPGFLRNDNANPPCPGIPLNERAYQFGTNAPFPASDPLRCTYFWTALVRLNPIYMANKPATNYITPSSTFKYDIYILVFHKGAVEHAYTRFNGSEFPGLRNEILDPRELKVPSVLNIPYSQGAYNANNSPPVQGEFPRLGDVGIGYESGSVFRQVLNPNAITSGVGAIPRPDIKIKIGSGVENIIYCPPADGTGTPNGGGPPIGASPLIYIYQTTLSL